MNKTKTIKKRELRPYLQKNLWLLKPIASFYLILSPIIIPIGLLWHFRKEIWGYIVDAYEEIWEALTYNVI